MEQVWSWRMLKKICPNKDENDCWHGGKYMTRPSCKCRESQCPIWKANASNAIKREQTSKRVKHKTIKTGIDGAEKHTARR